MGYRFTVNESHTLGVEVELQLIDSKSMKLANEIDVILGRVPEPWNNAVKRELMQSYCEFNTDVCRSVADVRADLVEKLRWGRDVAAEHDLQFAWAGTHPFSPWSEQLYSPGERYEWLTNAFQDISKRLVAFGLHVHVGVDSGDKAIQLCDRLLRHLPTLLALSVNSPFWNGRDTGLCSYRTKIMEALPTAGLPQPMRNWSEFCWLIEHLCDTGFINSIREIWWDMRPHHEFGTVEIRIMDMPINMNHALGLVALTQSLVAAVSKEIDRGAYQYDCHPMIAKQNKWHAARYGLDARFVDPEHLKAVSAREAVTRLVDAVGPTAESLGCAEELKWIDDILENGTGADRQRRAYEETGSLKGVVELLVEEAEGAVLA